MEYRKFGDTYVLRLDQGEEVMESLRRFAEAEQISLASVQGIGALSAFDLKAHHYEGCYEITSLLGTIDTMDGQFYCHLHLNAAEQDDRPRGRTPDTRRDSRHRRVDRPGAGRSGGAGHGPCDSAQSLALLTL